MHGKLTFYGFAFFLPILLAVFGMGCAAVVEGYNMVGSVRP